MKESEHLNSRGMGKMYEQTAGAYLTDKGYQVLQYNYRCKFEEIDLIAKDGAYLIFCEVKSRTGARCGAPSEAVNARKQWRISVTALFYLTEHDLADVPFRFDVISISGGEIRHIKNAFSYRGE